MPPQGPSVVLSGSLPSPVQHATRLQLFCRNHERNWPGLSDRASVNKSSDSGGEGGIIYDKRMGLGMPIVTRALLLRLTACHTTANYVAPAQVPMPMKLDLQCHSL